MGHPRQVDAARPRDAIGERVGGRAVERLARVAGDDGDGRGYRRKAIEIEAEERRICVRAATLPGEERASAVRERGPRAGTCDTGEEGLCGGGRSCRLETPFRVRGDVSEGGLRLDVGGRSVRWLIRDDGGRAIRAPGAELERNARPVADPDEGRGPCRLCFEDAGQIVDVDGDIEWPRIDDAARSTPPPIDGMDGVIPCLGDESSEA